jgi:glycosyltransferase involved in cell wall biosynthesis
VIYVCIPAHDEAATVGVLLWKTRKLMAEFGRDYRVVVLDDGSSDDTRAVLERYKKTLPLTVFHSDERLGYGRAVERLLRYVTTQADYPKRDCAVVLQGDFTEDPEDMISLVKVLEGGADVVAAKPDQDARPLPRGMRLARRAARVVMGGAYGKAPVSDPLTGLRAYRVIVLKKAFREHPEKDSVVTSDGWAANLELLAAVAPHARRIAEAPCRLRYDLQVRPSRFQPWRAFRALARFRGSSYWAGVGEGATS